MPQAGELLVERDVGQYDINYQNAQAETEIARIDWVNAVSASDSQNFPGATGSNPIPQARANWIAARQTAADLKVTYNQATSFEDIAYSKLVNARALTTTEGQQIIARETRGG